MTLSGLPHSSPEVTSYAPTDDSSNVDPSNVMRYCPAHIGSAPPSFTGPTSDASIVIAKVPSTTSIGSSFGETIPVSVGPASSLHHSYNERSGTLPRNVDETWSLATARTSSCSSVHAIEAR